MRIIKITCDHKRTIKLYKINGTKLCENITNMAINKTDTINSRDTV